MESDEPSDAMTKWCERQNTLNVWREIARRNSIPKHLFDRRPNYSSMEESASELTKGMNDGK